MTEIERLRAEVLELRSEIEEWKAYAHEIETTECMLAQRAAICRVFGMPPQMAALLQHLMLRAPMVISTDDLLTALPGTKDNRNKRIVAVLVCRARKLLEVHGYSSAIQAVPHIGRRMTKDTARAISNRLLPFLDQ